MGTNKSKYEKLILIISRKSEFPFFSFCYAAQPTAERTANCKLKQKYQNSPDKKTHKTKLIIL